MTSIASQQNTDGGPRVFIGYVKKFKFINGHTSELFGGHPKEGRLYRIIQYPSGGFGLYVGGREKGSKWDGIELGDILSGTYLDKWEFEVVELTEDNILDLAIEPDDLTNLSLWKDSANADLWDKLKSARSVVVEIQAPQSTTTGVPIQPFDEYLRDAIKKALEQEEEDAATDLIEEGATAFNKISDTNKELAYAICGLLKYIAAELDPKSATYETIYSALLKSIRK